MRGCEFDGLALDGDALDAALLSSCSAEGEKRVNLDTECRLFSRNVDGAPRHLLRQRVVEVQGCEPRDLGVGAGELVGLPERLEDPRRIAGRLLGGTCLAELPPTPRDPRERYPCATNVAGPVEPPSRRLGRAERAPRHRPEVCGVRESQL